MSTVWAIVGPEAAKFTPQTEPLARATIRGLLRPGDSVVSGACPGGGIDDWAIEEARAMGLDAWEHPAASNSWLGAGGFRQRNILVAQDCTSAVCITLRKLPASYQGYRWAYCYHCRTAEHVKSGGCWTVKYARSLGKHGEVIVI